MMVGKPPVWKKSGSTRGSLPKRSVKRIGDNTYPNVHSLLIVKDGKLVFEEYFGGYEWVYESDREV
jgi:hypothetical protein